MIFEIKDAEGQRIALRHLRAGNIHIITGGACFRTCVKGVRTSRSEGMLHLRISGETSVTFFNMSDECADQIESWLEAVKAEAAQ